MYKKRSWLSEKNISALRGLPALEISLALAAVVYFYFSFFPKHGDFITLNTMAKTFAMYGFDFIHHTAILYPSTYFIVQGAWIRLGSLVFGFDLAQWSIPPGAFLSMAQQWAMIPYLFCLYLFTAVSYHFLKNKWLSLLNFGSFTFLSLIVMGQLDIFCAFFIYLSLIAFVAAVDSPRGVLYLLLSVVFLGLSIQIVPFGGLLFPLYLVFMVPVLRKNGYGDVKCYGFLALCAALFIFSSFGIWLPYMRYFLPIIAGGESSFLINLQIAPIGLPQNHNIALWLLGYILILYFAADRMILSARDKGRGIIGPFIFYAFTTVAWMFISVYNLPQWWLILLPPMLLVLDHFKGAVNYLICIALMTLFFFYSMTWVDNIDMPLRHYVQAISIADVKIATVISTVMIALLAIWVINIKKGLDQDENRAGNGNSADVAPRPTLKNDHIAPFSAFLVPFVALICISAVATAITGYSDPVNGQANANFGEVAGEITIGQTFVASDDHLDGVEVYLGTYGRQNTHDVTFHLRPSPSGPDIGTVTVNASTIADNQYHRFRFPAIDDSKCKPYYFFLESPASTAGNAISVAYVDQDLYGKGMAYVNGRPMPGDDLTFKVHYGKPLGDIIPFI